MQQKMQKYSKYNHKGDAMAQYCACFLKQLRVPSAFCWLAVCGCHLLVKVLHGLFLLLEEEKSTEVRFFYYYFFFFNQIISFFLDFFFFFLVMAILIVISK